MEAFPENIQEAVIWKVLIQMLLALKHCHSKNVMHRDVKPANILIHFPGIKSIDPKKDPLLNLELETPNPELDLANAEFKLADFNISRETRSGFQQTVTGTPFFSSPELLAKRTYSY
jgi:serine/threonine protein kinase